MSDEQVDTSSRREWDWEKSGEGVEITGLRFRADAIDESAVWVFEPVPLTRVERLRLWWMAHRPRLHFGPCDDE